MMGEMKPCPFCGGAPELDTRRPYRNFTSAKLEYACAVYCASCGVEQAFCYADAPEVADVAVVTDVIAAWNRRTPPTTQGAGEPWSWDMIAAPQAAQVAFTNSLGMNAVAVCVRKGRGGLDRIGNHVSIASGWAIDGEETLIEDRGWRAYAWRKVEIPPLSAAPPAPASDHAVEATPANIAAAAEHWKPYQEAFRAGYEARELEWQNAPSPDHTALVEDMALIEDLGARLGRGEIIGQTPYAVKCWHAIIRLAAALHPSAEGGADKT